MYKTCNSMNNLSSYCELVDAKIRASDKDLPVSGVLNPGFQKTLTIPWEKSATKFFHYNAMVQVNIYQKLLFLHHLTQNMTRD